MRDIVMAFLRKGSKITRKSARISDSEVQTMSKFWSNTTWSVFSFTLRNIATIKLCDVEYNPVFFYLVIVQRDATLNILLFCKFTLLVSGANRTHHQEYIKL